MGEKTGLESSQQQNCKCVCSFEKQRLSFSHPLKRVSHLSHLFRQCQGSICRSSKHSDSHSLSDCNRQGKRVQHTHTHTHTQPCAVIVVINSPQMMIWFEKLTPEQCWKHLNWDLYALWCLRSNSAQRCYTPFTGLRSDPSPGHKTSRW